DEHGFRAALRERRSGIVAGEDGWLRARVGEFHPRRWIAPTALRRTPRLVQMTLVAAKQALAQAARLPVDGAVLPEATATALQDPSAALGLDSDRVGAVLGTGLGTFDQTMEFLIGYLEGGPQAASPLLFPTSVMNAAAGLLALECKLRGVNSTVNHKDSSPLLAIGMAMDALALGRADAIVTGAVDELSEFMLEGYRLLGGLGRDAMRPYDRARTGLALGESATMLVLERLDDARRRGAPIRAILRHRAERSDGRPRVGWGEGRASDDAVATITDVVRGRTIDWIAGSGNGTRLDELELSALQQAFGGALPPTSSILANSGESAASAMLRVVAAIGACETGWLPPTLGLSSPLDPAVLAAPIDRDVRTVLVPSFGQGGANAALLVERA
ncbi:MAG: beta-ketoacyl synthase N-terminal-like domain-containing protein, partial [Polyangia bacterium]